MKGLMKRVRQEGKAWFNKPFLKQQAEKTPYREIGTPYDQKTKSSYTGVGGKAKPKVGKMFGQVQLDIGTVLVYIEL